MGDNHNVNWSGYTQLTLYKCMATRQILQTLKCGLAFVVVEVAALEAVVTAFVAVFATFVAAVFAVAAVVFSDVVEAVHVVVLSELLTTVG